VRSEHVWGGIAAVVVAHNLTARDEDTLSECVDRWLLRHPVLVRAGITLLAVHLANVVSPERDPIHWLFCAARHRRAV
jgi:hypothetical protein